MEFLNLKATIVFTRLTDSVRGGQYHLILNEPFMPLSIEKIGHGIDTPWGKADAYSLYHFFVESGHRMQDPEMRFFVVDDRAGNQADYEKVQVAPYLFRQANLGIYEESVLMQGCTVTKFHSPMQEAHTAFANEWLNNIEQQGFLNF